MFSGNCGISPTSLIVSLSASDLPAGTEEWGTLGIWTNFSHIWCSVSSSVDWSDLVFSFIWADSSFKAFASVAFPSLKSIPISFAIEFALESN